MPSVHRLGRRTRAITVGLLCAAVSVPLAYVALETYVAVTISVGDTRLISRLIRAAFVVGLTSFGSGFAACMWESATEH